MNIVAVFSLAQKTVGLLPESLGRGVFNVVAEAACLLNGSGIKQLRRNQARILPGLSRVESRRMVRAGMRSYMRYYYECFRLPKISDEQIRARVQIDDAEALRSYFSSGTAVTGALMHAGNWDIAGAWAEKNLAHVHTLAEKLEPEELYNFFVSFRSATGMDVYPAGKGAIHTLESAMNSGACFTPILADRDLTASGIEVDFLGEKMMVAAGPALLAQRTGCPLVPVFSHYEQLSGERRKRAGSPWGVRLVCGKAIMARTTQDSPAAERREDVARMSQEWASQFEPWLREHPQDWHMLQKVFVRDLDPQRLAKTRERARAAAMAEHSEESA